MPESSSLTLEEALELVDSYEALPNVDDTDRRSLQRQIPSPSKVSTNVSTKPQKRVRNPLNDVRRRQRKKAERLQLKDQVQNYQLLLENLKRRKLCIKSTDSANFEDKCEALTQKLDKSPWQLCADEEDQKRQETEHINGKLKLLLKERLQVSGVIYDVLAKEREILEQSIDHTITLSQPPRFSPLQPSFTEYDLTSVGLKKTLQQVFNATDSVLAQFSANAFDSVETISRIKPQNQTSGPSIEVLTTTPLDCEFRTARNSVWEVIMDKEQLNNPSTLNLKTHEPSPQSVELRFSMNIDDPQGSQIILDGATLVEKHEEENRTVLAWTSLVVHQNQSLRFRSHGWVVATRCPTKPHAASAVRTCYRISAEHPAASICTSQEGSNESRSAARHSILKIMGQRVKSRLEGAQRQLLQRAGLPNEDHLTLI